MSRKIISCEECDAEFTVRHGMSEHHYEITYCVFCGASIPEDNEDDLYDEEEYCSEDAKCESKRQKVTTMVS